MVGEVLLTAKQVAEQLQVRHRAIYELVRKGELVGVMVGRYLRVHPRDLEAFLERQRTTPGTPPGVLPLAKRS